MEIIKNKTFIIIITFILLTGIFLLTKENFFIQPGETAVKDVENQVEMNTFRNEVLGDEMNRKLSEINVSIKDLDKLVRDMLN